jgi:Zn finger protein HypA/HybF involved in hydrogenase expression
MFVSGDGWAMSMDKVITSCDFCEEEYDLPEGMGKCPICGNKV